MSTNLTLILNVYEKDTLVPMNTFEYNVFRFFIIRVYLLVKQAFGHWCPGVQIELKLK